MSFKKIFSVKDYSARAGAAQEIASLCKFEIKPDETI